MFAGMTEAVKLDREISAFWFVRYPFRRVGEEIVYTWPGRLMSIV